MPLEILQSPAQAPESHPPLLFVHGAYCGAWIWAEHFLPYFSARGYGCHAVSLRGHGGSDGRLAFATLADYVADAAEAAGRIGRPPVVIGHSMGGLVVQHLLSRLAAAAAVLLSSVPPSGLGSSMMHMSLSAPDVLWQLGLLQNLGPAAVSGPVIHRAFFSDETSPSQVQGLLPRLQAESRRVSAEMLCPDQPARPIGHPPILVLAGDADLFLPVAAFRETATFFQADLTLLQGAPHGLMLDEHWWQPTADTILDWLAAKGL